MIQKNKKRNNNKKNRYFANRSIRASHVLCIDNDNKNLGILPLAKALVLANDANLDLVQINSDRKNPTCKILDFSKFKYEMSKKEKQAKKKQRESAVKTKEIIFRPSTEENDLRTKAKQAQSFINNNCRVKITIKFKGRELTHKDLAKDTLQTFLDMVPQLELIDQPQMNGRNLTAIGIKKENDYNR